MMVGVSGVRGRPGVDLTPEAVFSFAASFGSYCKKGKIVVGRDTRPSGEMLKHAVISALLSVGCEVVDLGIAPTPSIILSVKELGASGGIAITGSHNPPEWNALKFISSQGCFLDAKEGMRLKEIVERKNYRYVEWNEIGKLVEDKKAKERHIEKVLSLVDREKVRGIKVAFDAGNGATFEEYPLFLEKAGCEVLRVFCEPDGEFRRMPEPVPENLKELEKTVKKNKLHAGFATDADGDRISIVTDEGIAVGEEFTLALAVKYYLKKKKGPVVVNLSTSRMVEEIAKEAGVSFFRTKVGEANVVKLMKEKRAVIGGEGNGGVILPEVNFTRDGMVAMALILQYMAEDGKSLSQLVRDLPEYYMVKKKIVYENPEEAKAFLQNFRRYFKNERKDETDGIRVEWEDSWIHVRKSGTEPVVRIIAEADSPEEAANLVRLAMDAGKGDECAELLDM